MAKKDNPGLLREIATLTGHLAGSVEGGIRGTVHVAKHAHGEPSHDDTSFENSDINAKATFLFGVGLVTLLFLGIVFAYLCFAFLAHRRAAESPAPLPIEAHGNPMPPEPRLQALPRQDLKAFQATEDWELNHYHWLDKNKGTVAIPIEEAIKIVAARGIPPQKTPPNVTLTPPQAGTRDTGFEGKVEPEAR